MTIGQFRLVSDGARSWRTAIKRDQYVAVLGTVNARRYAPPAYAAFGH